MEGALDKLLLKKGTMMKRQSRHASIHFVASQLFRLGYKVDIISRDKREIDLSVFDPNNPKKKVVTIKVKGLKNKTNWPLEPKLLCDTHYFALVGYNNEFHNLSIMPEVFIIPSMEINHILSKWSGRPEMTCINYRNIKNSNYKEAWHLLFR